VSPRLEKRSCEKTQNQNRHYIFFQKFRFGRLYKRSLKPGFTVLVLPTTPLEGFFTASNRETWGTPGVRLSTLKWPTRLVARVQITTYNLHVLGSFPPSLGLLERTKSTRPNGADTVI